MSRVMITRRRAIGLTAAASTQFLAEASTRGIAFAQSADEDDAALIKRFLFLSQNGNSNCSAAFEASIAKMPASARLQGSCCAPMVQARYIEQVRGLRKYASFPEIPADPYDIPAPLAQKAMASHNVPLSKTEQAAYDFAMLNAEEAGPCCCQCWRWRCYGGLAKLLIRQRQFTGPQVVDIWNLSDGCGGGS